MADDPKYDHRHREFEPHERAKVREVVEAFFRGRWVRSLVWKAIGYITGALALMALFRSELAAWWAFLSGGGS